MFKWIFVAALVVNHVSSFEDLNVMQCLRENGLMDFVQLLKDAKQNTQLVGEGKI